MYESSSGDTALELLNAVVRLVEFTMHSVDQMSKKSRDIVGKSQILKSDQCY